MIFERYNKWLYHKEGVANQPLHFVLRHTHHKQQYNTQPLRFTYQSRFTNAATSKHD